jgi:hypothetical protein
VAKPPDKEWRAFEEWCEDRGLKALPAHPWTVAAYVRWCEPRQKIQNIVDSLKSITRMHLIKCQKAPARNATVTKILRQIEIRAENKDTRAALFQAEDFADVMKQATAAESSETTPSEISDPSESINDDQLPEPKLKRSMRNSPRLVRRLERRSAT